MPEITTPDSGLVTFRQDVHKLLRRRVLEAGDELLTYFSFPKAMWKTLRSTNSLENLNREFRRRTKTQASFPNEDFALTLLYGLIAFVQIRMWKINGHHALADLIKRQSERAA